MASDGDATSSDADASAAGDASDVSHVALPNEYPWGDVIVERERGRICLALDGPFDEIIRTEFLSTYQTIGHQLLDMLRAQGIDGAVTFGQLHGGFGYSRTPDHCSMDSVFDGLGWLVDEHDIGRLFGYDAEGYPQHPSHTCLVTLQQSIAIPTRWWYSPRRSVRTDVLAPAKPQLQSLLNLFDDLSVWTHAIDSGQLPKRWADVMLGRAALNDLVAAASDASAEGFALLMIGLGNMALHPWLDANEFEPGWLARSRQQSSEPQVVAPSLPGDRPTAD